MRILLFTPYLKTRGGGEKLIAEYAKRSRHEVDIYTLAYIPEMTFEEFENLNVIEMGLNVNKKFAEAFFIRGLVYTYSSAFVRLPVNKYDVMLVSTGGFSEFVSVRNRIPGATFMYCHSPLRLANDPMDMMFARMYAEHKRRRYVLPVAHRFYKILQHIGWRNFDYVFFNSNLSKQRAVSNKLIHEQMTHVIHPGVELPGKVNRSEDNYIIYVSRFTTMKRQMELLEAYKRFLEITGADVKLCLVGCTAQKWYYDKLVSMIKEYGLNDMVMLYPDVDDKTLHTELYPRALAGVFLGWREDFGIVPFEVMAHNKTLITTDCGGFTEIIDRKAPSVIFVRDALSRELLIRRLTDALVSFYNNMDEHIKNAKNNRKFIEKKNLTWDRFARDLDDWITLIYAINNQRFAVWDENGVRIVW